MLTDIVEKKRESGEIMGSRNGACVFCGQIGAIEVPVNWKDEDVDELITETCKCEGARGYARAKRRKERAKETVEKQFAETGIGRRVIQVMQETVDVVAEGYCDSVTIAAGNIKGKISMSAKGTIKVEKIKTEKESREA